MRSQMARQLQILTIAERDPTGSLEKVALFNAAGEPFDLEARLEVEPVMDWITVAENTLGNGWLYLSAPLAPKYRRRPDGTVECRGMLDPGAEGSTFITLPAGFRPGSQVIIPCASADGYQSNVVVDTNGEMSSYTPNGVAFNAVGWVNLGAVRFSIDE